MAAVDHPPVTARTRRLLAVLLVPLLVAVAVGTALLWPTGDAATELSANGTSVDATIASLRQVPCVDTAPEAGVRCVRPEARLSSGGAVALVEVLTGTDLGVGDHVVLRRTLDADGQPAYELGGYRRGRATAVLAAVGILLLLLVARRRGLQLLVALALSGLVLLLFTVPAGLRDGSAAGIAAVSGALVAIALLVVGRGPSARVATALVGSLVGLAIAAGLGHVAVVGGHLGGVDADPTDGAIVLSRLVLAGMVLAAVGAVTHAAVGVVDDTWDLRDADAEAGWRGVARAGLIRGRERIAGVAGALALAYVGTGLGTLAFLTADGLRLPDALALEPIATVVLGALVGTVAVLAAVPVTVALAAAIVVREAGSRGPDDPRRFRSRTERDLWEDV